MAPEALVPEWRERAAALGLDAATLHEVVGRAPARGLDGVKASKLLDRLSRPEGLTKEQSSFTRREVLQAIAEGLPAGADIGIGELERLADVFLGSERAVVLAEGEQRGEVVGVDGRAVTDWRVSAGTRRPSCWSASDACSPTPTAREARDAGSVERRHSRRNGPTA